MSIAEAPGTLHIRTVLLVPHQNLHDDFVPQISIATMPLISITTSATLAFTIPAPTPSPHVHYCPFSGHTIFASVLRSLHPYYILSRFGTYMTAEVSVTVYGLRNICYLVPRGVSRGKLFLVVVTEVFCKMRNFRPTSHTTI